MSFFSLPQELGNGQKNAAPSAGPGVKMGAERHTVANRRHGAPDLKGDFGTTDTILPLPVMLQLVAGTILPTRVEPLLYVSWS